ncbi:MAG TPA: hypothetical protein VK904_04825 [Miltoncostaeaceae bacterium]|nr:hypothetical protein [Miltoncostaeaceae bacterium]
MATPPSRAQPDDPRLRARADLLWYLRHADALARWPVLQEEWARRIERHRLEPPDRRGADPRLR